MICSSFLADRNPIEIENHKSSISEKKIIIGFIFNSILIDIVAKGDVTYDQLELSWGKKTDGETPKIHESKTQSHAHTHTHIYAHAHTRTCTHTHTHAHACTQTRTRTLHALALRTHKISRRMRETKRNKSKAVLW